jgi:hypothetical protein
MKFEEPVGAGDATVVSSADGFAGFIVKLILNDKLEAPFPVTV